MINALRERLARELRKGQSIENLIEDVMEIAIVPRCYCSTPVDPTKFSATTRTVRHGDYRHIRLVRHLGKELYV